MVYLFRTKSLLSPLAEKVSLVEEELGDLTNLVEEKRQELSRLETKVAETSQIIG